MKLLKASGVAVVIFIAAVASGHLVRAAGLPRLEQAATTSVMLLLSLAAIAATTRGGFQGAGFRRPEKARWGILRAVVFSAGTTAAILLAGGSGLRDVLSWLTAQVRRRTASLLPAVVIHTAFNAGTAGRNRICDRI